MRAGQREDEEKEAKYIQSLLHVKSLKNIFQGYEAIFNKLFIAIFDSFELNTLNYGISSWFESIKQNVFNDLDTISLKLYLY